MTDTSALRDLVALGLDRSRLWYSDPTGEAVVRNELNARYDGDFAVVDATGVIVFRIAKSVLEAALPLYEFTPSRRGKSLRAHIRKSRDG